MSVYADKFERKARDFYRTPRKPVERLVPHLACSTYAEPMCGDGAIIQVLNENGFSCTWCSDIEPVGRMVGIANKGPVEKIQRNWLSECNAETIVTNPPWPYKGSKGEPTVGMIRTMLKLADTVWVILPANFMHAVYFAPLASNLRKVVSVGRVSWEDNGKAGKENSAWYCFSITRKREPFIFPNVEMSEWEIIDGQPD